MKTCVTSAKHHLILNETCAISFELYYNLVLFLHNIWKRKSERREYKLCWCIIVTPQQLIETIRNHTMMTLLYCYRKNKINLK